MSNFVICERLEQETETEFNSDILKMKINDYYDTRRNSLEITKKKKIESWTLFFLLKINRRKGNPELQWKVTTMELSIAKKIWGLKCC